jgi:queuine tRNA-ribosyltransferase
MQERFPSKSLPSKSLPSEFFPFKFEVVAQSGLARRGVFHTPHGSYETPAFKPVGTKATVKGVDSERLSELGAQILLVNTYHLWLRPGPATVEALGGIHKFSGWNGPILSDSGGYQVFSLKGMRKLSEEGVEFRSHIDGERRFLTPELAIQIQSQLGVDIAMVLDECPSPDLSLTDARSSLMMTLRWAKRCLGARTRGDLAIFGITQGALHRELREEAIRGLLEIDAEHRGNGGAGFQGFAIGGLSVGESTAQMDEVLSYHPQQLPSDRPRYLMGVGTPRDIVTAVRFGIDQFDCVMPTRAGRFGRAFISGDLPTINIKNAQFALSDVPLDPNCTCLACRRYSRGYINHLFKVDEMLGPQLVSIHNLHHYQDLMRSIRETISNGSFEALYQREVARFKRAPEPEDASSPNVPSGGE